MDMKHDNDLIHDTEFYEIIPEFNSEGRLCNFGSGFNEKVKVPAEEWERFIQLAGRQHEIIDGVVVFNEDLEPCLPDCVLHENNKDLQMAELLLDLQYQILMMKWGLEA